MENRGLVNILAIDLNAPVDVSVEFEDMDEDDNINQEINLNEDKSLNVHQLSLTGQGDTDKCELQNCKNITGIKVPEKEIYKGSTQNAKVHRQNEQFISDETVTNGPQTEFGVQITQIKKVDKQNEKLKCHETEMNGPQTDIDLNKKHESQRAKLQTEINQTESQPDLPGHAIFVPNVNVKDFKEIMEFISKKANNNENSGNFMETSNNIGSIAPPQARNPVPQTKNPVGGIATLQTFIQNENIKSVAPFNNETSNQNLNYKSPTSLNEDYSLNNCPTKPNDPNFVDFVDFEKYMGLVLKTASEHAIRVLEYYYKYYDLKTTSNNKKETESAYLHYFESKEYLFSLSFSVISNLMVPQETNGAFMNKFVNDCLQLCGNRYPYSDFAVIYKEMITWAKDKAKLIETQTILTNAANLEREMESLISQKSLQSRTTYSHTQGTLNPATTPILMNMLNNVNTSITKSNASGHPVVPTRSNINPNNPIMQNNMFHRNILQKVNPSNMSNVVGNPGVTTGSNINLNNPGMHNNMLNANMLRNANPSNMSNVVGNPGVTTGSNINSNNPDMHNYMLNANMLRNANPSNMSNVVGNPGVTSGSNIKPNNPGMHNNMLNANMLRNVNPSNMSNVVGNHGVPTVSNINSNNPSIQSTMLYTNMLKNINASIMSNVLTGLNINKHNPNMQNNMLYPAMKWPVNSSEHNTLSRADLKHARIKKKSSNLPAVRCYPLEQRTYPPHDSIPQTTMLQTPVPQNVRVDIDMEHGNRNINISFIPNEDPIPIKGLHPHPKLCTNQSKKKKTGIIPPGNNTPNYSIPLNNNLMQPQQEQNALEATRSQSRDSGFMSPLSLNSPVDPTNTDKIDNTQNNVNPLITHVTSLNPNASYIDSSACSVCKRLTNLKCLGCYGVYYCSYQCQKSDWKFHRNLCSDRMIQNSK